jgi:hypothetical protein
MNNADDSIRISSSVLRMTAFMKSLRPFDFTSLAVITTDVFAITGFLNSEFELKYCHLLIEMLLALGVSFRGFLPKVDTHIRREG